MLLDCDDCDFCDFFAGRLLLSHHKDDAAAVSLVELCRLGQIDHVHYVQDMETKLKSLGVTMPDEFAFRLHLLVVPAGEEIWKINYLRFYYQSEIFRILGDPSQAASVGPLFSALFNSGTHMLLTPDAAMSFYAAPSVGFEFDQAVHATYKSMLGLPAPSSTGQGVTVAVIDSGLDASLNIPVSLQKNCSDDSNPSDVHDVTGHGSVVTSIIYDIVPDTSFSIFKVGNKNPVSEWNVIAALLAARDADIINVSVGFGLGFRDCPTCGRRQTHSSRSAVFEQAINEIARIRPELIVIAGAGNRNQKELDFPARFANVIAVGAVNSQGKRSTFSGTKGSNYGTSAAGGVSHPYLFFAPGGGSTEYVAVTSASGAKQHHQGTSFAAPYATALFAHYLGDQASTKSRKAAIDHFIDKASSQPGIAGYNEADHGHGIIRIL
jgi:subtilisin family serine protease